MVTELTMEEFIPKDRRIIIGGVDVTSYVVNVTVNEIPSGYRSGNASISANILEVLQLENGQTVEVWIGYIGQVLRRKLYGVLTNIQEEYGGYNISFMDELWKTTGETIVKIYDMSKDTDTFNGNYKAIVIDVVSELGLTATVDTIDDTDVVLPLIVCDNVKGIQKLEELANILGWNFYQDPETRLIHFRNPSAYTMYNKDLELGRNVGGNPRYGDSIYQVVNVVEIQGVEAYPVVEEDFIGDGTKKIYESTKKPFATFVEVRVDGILKKGAINEQQVPTADYLINQSDGKIEFKVAPTNNAAIKLIYTSPEITTITCDDVDSIEKNGVRKLVLRLNDVISMEDALQRGEAIVNLAKNGFIQFDVDAYNIQDLSVRQFVNYFDPLASKELLKHKLGQITWRWPDPRDSIVIGKNDYEVSLIIETVEERVRKLERINTEGLVLTINKSFTVDFYPVLENIEIYGDSSYGETEYLSPTIVDAQGLWEPYGSGYEANLNSPYTPSGSLIISGFGFDIPTTARITGIQLRINNNNDPNEYMGEGNASSMSLIAYAKIIINGEVLDVRTKEKSEWFNGLWGSRYDNWVDMTFDMSFYDSCYWGDLLTGADINASNFGFDLSCSSQQFPASIGISEMEVKVFYMMDGEEETFVRRKYVWENNAELEAYIDTNTSALVTNNTLTIGGSTKIYYGLSATQNADGDSSWIGTLANLSYLGPNVIGFLQEGQTTNTLDIVSFDIPYLPNTTIKGISVNLVVPGAVGAGYENDLSFIKNYQVQLLLAGSPIGNNKGNTEVFGGVFGGKSDLWGTTLDMTDITIGSFGVRIGANRIADGNGGTKFFGLDAVQIKIYYEED
jgi:hypothetical protein